MRLDPWLSVLQEVAGGRQTPEAALEILRRLPYEALQENGSQPFARLDHHRLLRTGMPEVVFGQGKTPAQIAAIVERLAACDGRALVTRAAPEAARAVQAALPAARYDETARLLIVGELTPPAGGPSVAVLTGGTADLPVAEEAALTLEWLGRRAERFYDVGVAGLHRLLDHLDRIREAKVAIVVAGMEGALATVVGGLVACPVVAVPTSVGYGAGFAGLAPLLTMLNSCVPGVAVVNIDNGFGAAALAHLILQVNEN
jgi:NCAIR mutase (PurE)-related protein